MHAEHGVELLQEDQPRVETPGECPVIPVCGGPPLLLSSPPRLLTPSPHLDPIQQMEQKMTASDIFKDKKDNYPQSVPKLFVNTRLSEA